jgi:RNA polymerase sigma factor (sigma-70 family)
VEKEFIELEEQYASMIWKIIHSLNIYKHLEEFYQTGLIALWEAKCGFDEEKGSFTSYAYAFIRGKILTDLTKRSKYEDFCTYPEEEYWGLIEDQSLQAPLEKDNILSYCEKLSEHQKKWVLYTALADLSIREIAEIENVSVSAVKGWRKGAREKILGEIEK